MDYLPSGLPKKWTQKCQKALDSKAFLPREQFISRRAEGPDWYTVVIKISNKTSVGILKKCCTGFVMWLKLMCLP